MDIAYGDFAHLCKTYFGREVEVGRGGDGGAIVGRNEKRYVYWVYALMDIAYGDFAHLCNTYLGR